MAKSSWLSQDEIGAIRAGRSLGHSPREIADFLGRHPKTIRATISKIEKESIEILVGLKIRPSPRKHYSALLKEAGKMKLKLAAKLVLHHLCWVASFEKQSEGLFVGTTPYEIGASLGLHETAVKDSLIELFEADLISQRSCHASTDLLEPDGGER